MIGKSIPITGFNLETLHPYDLIHTLEVFYLQGKEDFDSDIESAIYSDGNYHYLNKIIGSFSYDEFASCIDQLNRLYQQVLLFEFAPNPETLEYLESEYNKDLDANLDLISWSEKKFQVALLYLEEALLN